MKNTFEKIKEWISNGWKWICEHKDLIGLGIVAYIVHLTLEGLAANLIFYKGIKPAYAALTT